MITFVAKIHDRNCVTLLIYGTVLDERGFTSVTYTVHPTLTMNWILISPMISKVLLFKRFVYSTMVALISSPIVGAGYMERLSPECTRFSQYAP